MPLSFKQLTDGKAAAVLFGELLTSLKGRGLPIDDWSEGAVEKTTLEFGLAPATEAIWTALGTMAKGGALRLAQGLAEADIANWEAGAPNSWLYVLAKELFNVTPFEPEFTVGTERFTNASLVAQNLSPSIVVSTQGGLRYTVMDSKPLPAGAGVVPGVPAVYVKVKAEKAGSAYNVGAGAISQLNVSLPGVSVGNQPDPSTGATSWITTSGSNRELPKDLADRCAFRWARLALLQTLPADGYKSAVRDRFSQVKKMAVWSNYSHALPGFKDRVVTLYLAGDTAPVDPAVAVAVFAAISPYINLCDVLEVQPCGTAIWVLTGTVFASEASLIPGIKTAVEANLVQLQQSLDIGQVGHPWRVRAAVNVPGVSNFADTMVDPYIPAKNALIALDYSGLQYQVGT